MIRDYHSEGNPLPTYKIRPNLVYSQLLGDPFAASEAVIPGCLREAPLTLTFMYPESAEVPTGLGWKPTPRRMPCIVNCEGGGWNIFQKDQNLANLTYLCDAGFAVAAVDFRRASESHFPSAIRDIKCAIRFLRTYAADFDIDPARFGVIGSSAGGHLAAFIGASGETRAFDSGGYLDQSSAVQAACDMFGPVDFLKMDEDPNHAFFRDHCDPLSPESRFVGGPLKEVPEKVARANPANYVSANTPPMLILHGDKDGDVGYTQSLILYDALKSAGNDKAEMYRVIGHGHGGPGFNEPKMRKIITDFFKNAFAGP